MAPILGSASNVRSGPVAADREHLNHVLCQFQLDADDLLRHLPTPRRGPTTGPIIARLRWCRGRPRDHVTLANSISIS